MSEDLETITGKTDKGCASKEQDRRGYINWARVELKGLKIEESYFREGQLLPLKKEKFYL